MKRLVFNPPPRPKMAKCSHFGCKHSPIKRGMCEFHYKRWTRTEEIRAAINAPGRNVLLERMSAIYVIGFLETEYVKIGVTDDVASRLNGMQTGCPYPMLPFGALYAGRAEVLLLEGMTHKTLADLEVRSRGEWFDISPLDALAVIGKVADQNGIWMDPPAALANKIAQQDYDHTMLDERTAKIKTLRAVHEKIERSLEILRAA